LQCLGYFPENIVANGNFGLVTETATKKFQSANNLDSLGYVGVATRKVLNTY
jgi:peptidoglycan hydrolase-like protein with peptidoglycan-binding domain